MVKKVFVLCCLCCFNSCNLSERFYVLSTAPTPKIQMKSKYRVIGIEKVSIPKYLFKREIAIAQSSSEVSFLKGASWAEDLDDGITNRFVGFLQKKFNEPNVYVYPWGITIQPDITIKLQITRFIAQDNRVSLEANWVVENLHTQERKAKLFSTSVTTTNDASMIVASMDKALHQLEESLAKAIQYN